MLDDEHVLHVFDVADATSALWEWSTHSPLDPLTGQTTDLIVLDSQLWLLGDARDNASAVQQLWVHRFDIGSPGQVTHDLDEWMGGTNALVPRGVFDPTSGYVALFAAHAGASASHMRIFIRDPQTGEEILSTFDYAYDRPLDVCTRPDGGLLVLASEAGAPSSRLALGYRIGQDGALEQDGELALDFAWGVDFIGCVTGGDAMLLIGTGGTSAAVVAVADLFGSRQQITWQHYPVQLGFVSPDAAVDGVYHDGRFFVTVGYDPAGVIAFAE
ncbi:MAG: hypothetical protein KDK70_19615 [Myxococcales bacterium]|nr:hypothetical protein [Myxococcales bacterium]